MELRWIASLSASACYLAYHVAIDTPDDGSPSGQSGMAVAGEALFAELRAMGVEPEQACEHLLPLAADVENNRQVADVLLRRLQGLNCPSHRVTQLAGRLTDLEIAVSESSPDLLDELDLRSKPLRELWEARGPGMLRRLAELTDAQLLVERANVLIMPPVAGGAGHAHLSHNCVRIESVLANPHAELPEVVRLGWLLAQLNLDLPIFCEAVQPQRVSQLSQLAMLPAALQAGQHVELANFSPRLVATAVAAWCPQHLALTEQGQVLIDWWETFAASRPPLALGIAALDRMLLR